MPAQRETLTGWVVSLGIHALILLLFLAISVPEIIQNQEFIEVVWGLPTRAESAQPAPATEKAHPSGPQPELAAPEASSRPQKATQPVFLPERRVPDRTEETIPLVRSEKISPEDSPGLDKPERTDIGERQSPGSALARDQRGTVGGAPGSSVGPASGPSGPGLDVERGVSFSIQWADGGTRRKISGDLPAYPEGVNLVAQIKIVAVVAPDGAVKSTQPAQKANTVLEEAAMKQVRLWKFEPLRPSQPQSDQSCIVTFLFTLK